MSWRTARKIWPWVLGLLCVLGAVLLAAGAYVIWAQEHKWVVSAAANPGEAFEEGSVGTEWIPLSVLEALPRLFPERFQPRGPAAGDWVEQFGFTRREGEALPVGFVTNPFRPRTAVSSPITFVGLGCAVCHSGEIRKPDGEVVEIVGMGSTRLNLAGFLEATRGALMAPEEALNVDTVSAARLDAEGGDGGEGVELSMTERVLVGRWLRKMREELAGELALRGEPLGPLEVNDPTWSPEGPGRLHPLSELMQTHGNRRAVSAVTGRAHAGYTKIPAVFRQELRSWQQVDGSIGDEAARTTVDVMAAGATAQSLTRPVVRTNLVMSTAFTRSLEGPRYEALFPEGIRRKLLARGKEVYETHCVRCHGDRDEAGEYVVDSAMADRLGSVVAASDIGTDAERVSLRGRENLPGLFESLLVQDHPLVIDPAVIRPSDGYVAAPLDSVFARAPYLHNGSVPTLAALVHLEERPAVFYRGRNLYDPYRVGLDAPTEPDEAAGLWFRYDTAAPGNSNAGHDFPWTRAEVASDPKREADLEALLEYLKTL